MGGVGAVAEAALVEHGAAAGAGVLPGGRGGGRARAAAAEGAAAGRRAGRRARRRRAPAHRRAAERVPALRLPRHQGTDYRAVSLAPPAAAPCLFAKLEWARDRFRYRKRPRTFHRRVRVRGFPWVFRGLLYT